MGDVVYFYPAKINEQISCTPSILCLRISNESQISKLFYYIHLYILKRLFLAAPSEYIHPGLFLELD
jgi:hypothetical protein